MTPIAAPVIEAPVARAVHRRRRGAALAVVGVVVTSMGAAAAAGLLGRPAPERVKAHIAELDRGLPAGLRANPLLDTARSVAESPTATLFAANTADGGYCLEVVTARDTPRGASCVTGPLLASRPIEVNSPIVHGDEPVVLAGRVDVPDSRSLQIVHADGATEDVAVSSDGYWIAELMGGGRQSALTSGVTVRAVNARGASIAETVVPPLADSPPPDSSNPPIEVNTVSNGDDLTLVLAVEGTVHRPGAASLELTYPDGTSISIRLGSDGSYRYRLPRERQRDLSDEPARLVARDSTGTVIATAAVGSVAFWHRQNP